MMLNPPIHGAVAQSVRAVVLYAISRRFESFQPYKEVLNRWTKFYM